MLFNKDIEKKIKDLEINYDDKLYFENEILSKIREISNSIKLTLKNENINDDIIINMINQYLYISKNGKYYFNFNRKQLKKKEYHDKIRQNFNQNISSDIPLQKITKQYKYPQNFPFNIINKTHEIFGPFGTQWFHDNQFDDILDDSAINFSKQFDILKSIKLPEQKSSEWYAIRDSKLTASDAGTVLGLNPYEPQYKFIIKKTSKVPFVSNEFVHHGKKYEEIATLIYEYRRNVSTDEFGLIVHNKYKWLGASPDRICNKYKLDKIHLSKYIGRMIEIKCPFVRKIVTNSSDVNIVCPIYYWIQIQLQLECCDLEECDFWQCEIKEYKSNIEFIQDTDADEPFRSVSTKFEKGCLIQLLPKKRINDILQGKYDNVVYDDAKFIYPPKIEMSPLDCDLWIINVLNNLNNDSQYQDYYFDKIIYWKLVKSNNITINRDRKWFQDNLPIMQKIWNYVIFLKNNPDKLVLFNNYINSLYIKKNKDIMIVIDKICNVSDPNYDNNIINLIKDINKLKSNNDNNDYMFIDPIKNNT